MPSATTIATIRFRRADYYRLRAVFEPAYDWKHWRRRGDSLVSLWTAEDRAKSAEVDAEVTRAANERTAVQAGYMEETFEKELTKFDDELAVPLR